jgi:hypothetical protein
VLPEDGFRESCCLLVCYRPLAAFWPANLNGSACSTSGTIHWQALCTSR